MKPQLVVFDLAGTTVKDNQDVHRMLQAALAAYQIDITLAEANAVMGIPKPVAIATLLEQHHHPEITPTLIADIHRKFVKLMIEFYQSDPGVQENEGVSETFFLLRNNKVKVVVDTGFDRLITRPLLRRMGWMDKGLVDASVTSDEVKRGRPHPDMIFRAMELTDTKEVSAVAKIGDTASDIQEGRSAGCGWVVGITTGAFSASDLEKENPTHLIRSIPEILSVLEIK